MDSKLLPDEPKKVLIKKYSNRRLYDVTHSQHVTIDEMIEMIRDNYDVEVIDSKTKKDITKGVLLQVLLDEEKNGSHVFTSGFLHHLIRNSDGLIEEFFTDFVPKLLDSYMDMKETMKRQLSNIAPMNWLQLAKKDSKSFLNPFHHASPINEENSEAIHDEIESLQERIRTLEAKLDESKKSS